MIILTERLPKNADSATGTSVTISAAELKIYLKEESLANKKACCFVQQPFFIHIDAFL